MASREFGLLEEEVRTEEEDGGMVSNAFLPSRRDCDGTCAAGSFFHEERHPWETCDNPVGPNEEETPQHDYCPT